MQSYASKSEPHQLDGRYRLTISKSIKGHLQWLTGESPIEAKAWVGNWRQLVISPEGPIPQNDVERIRRHYDEMPPGHPSRWSGELADLSRIVEQTCNLTFQVVNGKEISYRLTLPENLRKLEILPPPKSIIYLMSRADLLEIWKLEYLQKFWAQIGTQVDSIYSRVKKELN